MTQFLKVSRSGPVVTARLNRPERSNALSSEILSALEALADRVNDDVSIRAVILTGEGGSFSAGADLKERKSLGVKARWRYVEDLHRAIERVEGIAVPVIAAVNGFALGGGTELMLACDLRIAVKDAVVGLTETGLGIIPSGCIVRLVTKHHSGLAARLAFTAARYSAAEAQGWGLIDEVVEERRALERRTRALAREIAGNAPLALRAAKRLMRSLSEPAIAGGMRLAEAIRAPLDATEDCMEGLRAFAEKRRPVFKGR